MENNEVNQKTNNNDEELRFWGSKASFVAGLAVLETVLRDVIHLICQDDIFLIDLCILFVTISVFFLALCTKKLDQMLSSKGADRVGMFLTIMAVIVFLLEIIFDHSNMKTMLLDVIEYRWFVAGIFLAMGMVGAWGTLKLYFHKYE